MMSKDTRSDMDTGTPRPEPMTLVVGSDDNYAIGLAVTISTALTHTPETAQVRLIVVDGGISAVSRDRLTRVVGRARPETDLVWFEADGSRFAGLKTTKWGSTANYLRLLMPEIIGDSARWAIYLDSDLLVRSGLEDLWKRRLTSSRSILAVRDFHNMTLGAVFGETACDELGLDPSAAYFNSGMIVVDVEAWRDRDIPGRAVRFVQDHWDVMSHSDQDALNAELAGDWEQLEPRWNVMIPSLGRFVAQTGTDLDADVLLDDGAIYHFTGPRKPWLPGYWGPAGREYRDALDRSGWFDDEPARRQWHRSYWARSPRGWAAEAYRRTRKKAALRLRSLRS